ncbi:Diacylglycerol kinase theta [Takifugu flavidus]|uniref:Diacylglycerol kinase n=1 Tax=Takifugu flavidus TaxID=433684 RepID=A0A5C6MK23_9TELE|nr:Diacylglycerol kinase theta [Takifugu flavidus]
MAEAEAGRKTPDLAPSNSQRGSPVAAKARTQRSVLGHCLKKVTLTRPTFCHSCSDFIWGLVGFLCEAKQRYYGMEAADVLVPAVEEGRVHQRSNEPERRFATATRNTDITVPLMLKTRFCNFMCHERCVKMLSSVCSCRTPSAIRVPVAHCLVPAGHKRRFCCVCRKQTEGNSALRCEVCELHVHADCAAFSCADCRRTHQDAALEQVKDTFHHHWREGSLGAAARCEVCRRSCGSSDVLVGVRCEWCGITTHAACCSSLPAGCALGRLRCMLLHPACVELTSRNFSRKQVYRLTEDCSPDQASRSVNSGGKSLASLGRISPREEVLQVLLSGLDRGTQFRCFHICVLMKRSEGVQLFVGCLHRWVALALKHPVDCCWVEVRVIRPDNSDDVDPSAALVSKDGQSAPAEAENLLNEKGRKQSLRVFDGDDAFKRGSFRLVSLLRATTNEEVVEAALRAFYLPDEPQDYELLQIGCMQRLHGDDSLNHRGPNNRSSLKDAGSAWLLRAKPGDTEVIKVYAGWARTAETFVSILVSKVSTSKSVLTEVLVQLNVQDKDASRFSLMEVLMSSKQVLKQTLSPQEKILDKVQEIRKVSLRQMNQTRFYIVENVNQKVQVNLLIGELPPLLAKEEYSHLLQEHMAVKGHLVMVKEVYSSQGALALQISCFSEAERIYMLAKDTMVNNRMLTSLLVPQIQVVVAAHSCKSVTWRSPGGHLEVTWRCSSQDDLKRQVLDWFPSWFWFSPEDSGNLFTAQNGADSHSPALLSKYGYFWSPKPEMATPCKPNASKMSHHNRWVGPWSVCGWSHGAFVGGATERWWVGPRSVGGWGCGALVGGAMEHWWVEPRSVDGWGHGASVGGAAEALVGGATAERLASDVCPLLVFVNPKSGGLKGRELLHSFRKLLNPHQVFDITNGGPLAGLHTFREVPRFRVLVCGGDGTVGWVLGVLEAIRHHLVCREPPISIVPLGTGNDLARVLRWGSGYTSEDPHHILVSVDEAEEVLMDRWTILLDAQDISEDGRNNEFLEPPKIVQMNNYFGLGIDADLSLDFHLAREGEPDKFTSRLHNKGVYVKVGLQKISHSRSLHKELQLQVDNQKVPVPNIEGLIFLNIPSWGSGADLWGSEVDDHFRKPRIDDGLLEVVGVTGVVHMGQVQSGIRSGIRIAQGNYIRLTVSKAVPVQVDGEPWVQPPGHVIISAAGPKVRMLRKSKQKQRKSSAGVKDGCSESPSSRDGGR